MTEREGVYDTGQPPTISRLVLAWLDDHGDALDAVPCGRLVAVIGFGQVCVSLTTTYPTLGPWTATPEATRCDRARRKEHSE